MYCIATGKGLVYISLDEPVGHLMIANTKCVEQQIGQDLSLQEQKLGKWKGHVR